MDDKASAAYKSLERMLLHEDEAPTPMMLPLSLLEAITNNFSDERVLGRGGFAVVYKVGNPRRLFPTLLRLFLTAALFYKLIYIHADKASCDYRECLETSRSL